MLWAATVLCSFDEGDVEETAQQVYIGTQNNTKSGVRTGFSANPIAEVPTTGILNCDNEVTFWVAWGGGSRRRFGRGTIVDINVVLSWEDNSNLVTSVGFANAHQQGAFYTIRKNIGWSFVYKNTRNHEMQNRMRRENTDRLQSSSSLKKH